MEIARLFGTLGFKFDPKGLESFQKGLKSAHQDMTKFANGIKHEVNRVNAELATLKSRLNFSGGQIGGTQKFSHLKDAITQAKVALDSLHARSSLYGSSIANINSKAAAGIPIWRAYKSEIVSVQHALQSLSGTMSQVHSASRISINARNPQGVSGSGAGVDSRNNGLALLLGGVAGGGLFNTARTAIIAGMSNAAVFGTGALIKSVIDRGREFRQSEQALLTNSKDKKEYENILEYVKNFSKDLGVDLTSAIKSTGNALGAYRAGGGEDIAGLLQTVKNFNEYYTTMHLSADQQKRANIAFEQMYGTQKIGGQEILQFSNAGVNLRPLLAKAIMQADNVDAKKAREMVKAGGLSAEKYLPIIARLLGEVARNNGALERAKHSSQAEQARFKSSFDQFSANVMENGGDQALAKFFSILTKVVEWTNKFYDNMVAINKLFSKMTGGHSAWIWALNLFIIMLGRGAISLNIFRRNGSKMLPLFWGLSRSALKTRGVFGLLKVFIETPFMRVLLAFAKRWLWIITVFQMVMSVGAAMNAHMQGYTTWFDVWIAYVKHLVVWFDILALKAYIAMRRVGIAMHLSQPDINEDGSKNEETSFLGRSYTAGKFLLHMGSTLPSMAYNSVYNNLFAPPDPEELRKATATQQEKAHLAELDRKRAEDNKVHLYIHTDDGKTREIQNSANKNSHINIGSN